MDSKEYPKSLAASLKELSNLSPAHTVDELNEQGYFTRNQAAKSLKRSPEWARNYMQDLVRNGKAEAKSGIGRNGQTQVLWRLL